METKVSIRYIKRQNEGQTYTANTVIVASAGDNRMSREASLAMWLVAMLQPSWRIGPTSLASMLEDIGMLCESDLGPVMTRDRLLSPADMSI